MGYNRSKTQSIYDYLKSYDLDPFKDSDLVYGAKTLGMYYYDGVPKEVMDKLFVKFMRKFMMNEFFSSSTDMFRLELMNYMQQQEMWYTKMFNLYSDLLPYEMLNQTTEQITDNLTINEQTSIKDHLNNTNTTSQNRNQSDGLTNTMNEDTMETVGSEDGLSEVSDSKTGTVHSDGTSENNVLVDNNELRESSINETSTADDFTNNESDVIESSSDTSKVESLGTESSVTDGTREDTTTKTTTTDNENTQTDNKNETTNNTTSDSNVNRGLNFKGTGSISDGVITTSSLNPDGRNTVSLSPIQVSESEHSLDSSKNKNTGNSILTIKNTSTSNDSGGSTSNDSLNAVSKDTTNKDSSGTQDTTNTGERTSTTTDIGTSGGTHVKESNSSDTLSGGNITSDKGASSDTVNTSDTGSTTSSNSLSRENKDVRNATGNTTNKQTDTSTGSNVSRGTSKETSKGDSENKLKGKQTTVVSGMNQWKPELARKFYENFVDVDEQWLNNRSCRQLFTMVYS